MIVELSANDQGKTTQKEEDPRAGFDIIHTMHVSTISNTQTNALNNVQYTQRY